MNHQSPPPVERDKKNILNTGDLNTLAIEILGILNDPPSTNDSIKAILAVIQQKTGFDAVGIRLQSGEDFPYFVQHGFSSNFLLTENSITAKDGDRGCCKDKDGNVSLECTCGLVISGKTDPSNPAFTKAGSSWTNNSLPFLDLPAEQDIRLHPRNHCIHEGYLSVALVPIRSHGSIVGLLQLNDRRKDCFTLEMIHFFEGIAGSIGVALLRKQAEEERERIIGELKQALLEVKKLSGMLPVCASCKKIRDDKGYWNQIETYISEHADVVFSHSICPDCVEKMYPDVYEKLKNKGAVNQETV